MTLFFEMKPDKIYFVPLGGCGMFGANMSLYGYQDQWIMVDCGMGFADDTMPGVDVLFSDPEFAVQLEEKLLGILLTHGHEDHIGGLKYLWPRLKKPLYATKFTAERIRQGVTEQSWGNQTNIQEIIPGEKLSLGPFEIDYIRMAHSIPEATSLAIEVKDIGTILHTGDWKLDPNPVEGYLTDEKALQALGDKGVLALVGDSTNAMVPGHSGSELTVKNNLIEIFGEFKKTIAISCFSTNVARLRSIAEAARENGRQVCLVGRSLEKIDKAARLCGYLENVDLFLDVDEAGCVDRDKIVYVCTGSQGEPRAALSRISAGDHPRVGFSEGDVIIFSSRTIPGNERAINNIKNRFYAAGLDVITESEAPVHVSGHPYREELKKLYEWTRPKLALSVHGEQMQLETHAGLAEDLGVEHSVIPINGDVLEISKDGSVVLADQVDAPILALEGNRLVKIDHEAILIRKRIMYNGSAVVTVVVDRHGALISDPRITALGLLDENCDLDAEHIQAAIDDVKHIVETAPKFHRKDDEALSELIRVTARRFFAKKFERKPQTRVHLIRI